MQTGSAGLQSAEATCPLCRGQAGYVRSPLLVRSVCKNEFPCVASRSSSFFVQSQSQQAHGSLPFSCRQLRRECASFMLSKSKYSSQYGRSSASGGSQKQVSTQVAAPASSTRACCMLCTYSSPAIEPRPRVCWSIAWMRAGFFPGLTRAFTRYRIGENITTASLLPPETATTTTRAFQSQDRQLNLKCGSDPIIQVAQFPTAEYVHCLF